MLSPQFGGVYRWHYSSQPSDGLPSELPVALKKKLQKETGATHCTLAGFQKEGKPYVWILTRDKRGDHLYLQQPQTMAIDEAAGKAATRELIRLASNPHGTLKSVSVDDSNASLNIHWGITRFFRGILNRFR